MFSINIISVILIPFKYVFNCGSLKISNFEKLLGLSWSLATPAIGLPLNYFNFTNITALNYLNTEIFMTLRHIKHLITIRHNN